MSMKNSSDMTLDYIVESLKQSALEEVEEPEPEPKERTVTVLELTEWAWIDWRRRGAV
jgi:hypothetical protein